MSSDFDSNCNYTTWLKPEAPSSEWSLFNAFFPAIIPDLALMHPLLALASEVHEE